MGAIDERATKCWSYLLAKEQKISEQDKEQVIRLLKHEIQRTAARLIKVRQSNALMYAKEQITVMADNDQDEDQVFWEKIADEFERQLST
jgi:hypothetical protein